MFLTTRSRRLRRSVVFATAAALPLLVLGTSMAAQASSQTSTSGQAARLAPAKKATVNWAPCNDGFYCANVRVPLDYDHPRGATISLALVKQAASDPAHRIGSLFVNPGGPGGSGVDFVLDAAPFLFTPEVRARFDIVGFDPRGVVRSTPLRCFDTEEQAFETFAPFPYPNSRAKERVWINGEHQLDRACARRGGAIMNHMSTGDVARDLDQLRQMVGDRKLTYYGVSYGSMIGNTYANLFPRRFRALTIDGVLDPVAWTTGRDHQGRRVPFSTRLNSADGARATLDEFLRLCDAGADNCAFAPHAATRYADLYRTLKRHPIRITDPDGNTFDYDESFLVADTLGALYDASLWPDLADLLAALEDEASPAKVAAARAAMHNALAEDYVNFVESFPGVACSDSVNPPSYAAWHRAASRGGTFGPIWTWISSVCADWPGHSADRYLGPFTHRTSKPVLVVGNLFDPATRYQGAVTADRLLPNSRLLTVHAWGHTSLFTSACADQAIGHYLLTSQPPPAGTVCQADEVPFAQPSTAAVTRSQRPAAVVRDSRGPRWFGGW